MGDTTRCPWDILCDLPQPLVPSPPWAGQGFHPIGMPGKVEPHPIPESSSCRESEITQSLKLGKNLQDQKFQPLANSLVFRFHPFRPTTHFILGNNLVRFLGFYIFWSIWNFKFLSSTSKGNVLHEGT